MGLEAWGWEGLGLGYGLGVEWWRRISVREGRGGSFRSSTHYTKQFSTRVGTVHLLKDASRGLDTTVSVCRRPTCWPSDMTSTPPVVLGGVQPVTLPTFQPYILIKRPMENHEKKKILSPLPHNSPLKSITLEIVKFI